LLTVNGRAKEELQKILSTKTESHQDIVRLVTNRPGEFGLGMDAETPDDHVIEHNGLKVLLVDRELANRLGEYTLAFEDKEFVMAKGPLSGFNKSVVTFRSKESE
jgi:Fe-S cluster assembly iron-binding protein IscA